MSNEAFLDHDPDVVRVLNQISTLRAERDGLALDLTNARAELKIADAANNNLREQIKAAADRCDFYMRRLVEVTTHFQLIHSAVKNGIDALDRSSRREQTNGGPASDQAAPLSLTADDARRLAVAADLAEGL
jgi:hypothetical protein